MTMTNELSKIKTLVEKAGFPAGTIGIVVSLYGEGKACEEVIL